MSDLEQQCEQISNQRGPWSVGELIGQKITLLAYISELQSELAALRRPVVHSDEIQAIKKRLAKVFNGEYVFDHDDAMSAMEKLAAALDHSEREKAMVGEALAWTLNHCGYVHEGVVYSLDATSLPPENLTPILLQYAGSKQA